MFIGPLVSCRFWLPIRPQRGRPKFHPKFSWSSPSSSKSGGQYSQYLGQGHRDSWVHPSRAWMDCPYLLCAVRVSPSSGYWKLKSSQITLLLVRNSHQTTEALALLNPPKENQAPPKYPFHSPSNLQPQLAATATDTPGGRHNDALAVELKLRQACQSCKFLLGSCVLPRGRLPWSNHISKWWMVSVSLRVLTPRSALASQVIGLALLRIRQNFESFVHLGPTPWSDAPLQLRSAARSKKIWWLVVKSFFHEHLRNLMFPSKSRDSIF